MSDLEGTYWLYFGPRGEDIIVEQYLIGKFHSVFEARDKLPLALGDCKYAIVDVLTGQWYDQRGWHVADGGE